MSRAIFSYNDMEESATDAHEAANELNDYESELNQNVTRKLDHYSGTKTGSVSSAAALIQNKRRLLRDKADDFEAYSSSIRSLINECKSTDMAVSRHISSLTQQFTGSRRISNVEYRMALQPISCGSASLPARWLCGMDSQFTERTADKGQDFAYWYKYGGGKYAIEGNIKAALTATAAVAAMFAAAASFTAAPLAVPAIKDYKWLASGDVGAKSFRWLDQEKGLSLKSRICKRKGQW